MLDDRTETTDSLSDETIAWLLGQHSNVWYAAAAGADIIGASFTSSVSEKQVGDLKIKTGAGDPAKQYKTLAESLRRQAAVNGFGAYSGGISRSDKDAQREDTDWDRGSAEIGMHDNPNANSTSGVWRF